MEERMWEIAMDLEQGANVVNNTGAAVLVVQCMRTRRTKRGGKVKEGGVRPYEITQ